MDPCIGKMLVMGATFGCLEPVLTIAAGMAYRDPFVMPIDKKELADEVKREFSNGTRSDCGATSSRSYAAMALPMLTNTWFTTCRPCGDISCQRVIGAIG